jgi:hypothetical protein
MRASGGISDLVAESPRYGVEVTTEPILTARTLDDAQRERARDLVQRLKDPTLRTTQATYC